MAEDDLSIENYHIQPENQFFYNCYSIEKNLKEKSKNIFLYRLECADTKYRFANYAFDKIKRLIEELERGEFIYLQDSNRLRISYYLESFLVFSRTAFDLSISGYFTYFHDTTNLDSLNNFIKKVKKDNSWIPNANKEIWQNLIDDYESEQFNWINTIVGSKSGVSLRDKAVHKGNIRIETIINSQDKGCFILHLNSQEIGYLMPWLFSVKMKISEYMSVIQSDILLQEMMAKLKNKNSH